MKRFSRLFGHLVRISYVTLLRTVVVTWVSGSRCRAELLLVRGGWLSAGKRFNRKRVPKARRKEGTPLCKRKSVKVKFSYLNKWLLSTPAIVLSCLYRRTNGRTDRGLLGQSSSIRKHNDAKLEGGVAQQKQKRRVDGDILEE